MPCDNYECRMRAIERDHASDKAMRLEAENARLRELLAEVLDDVGDTPSHYCPNAGAMTADRECQTCEIWGEVKAALKQ